MSRWRPVSRGAELAGMSSVERSAPCRDASFGPLPGRQNVPQSLPVQRGCFRGERWTRGTTLPLAGTKGFSLVAIGGYGRSSLFPFSDVDLLFLHAEQGQEEILKDAIRNFSQELWDLGLKLSPASRTLAECDRFDAKNIEFFISLLECRFLAGDKELYARLRDRVIPAMVERESQQLVLTLMSWLG